MISLEHHIFLNLCISHHVSGLLATPCGEGNLKLAKFLIEDCGATLRRDRFGLLPIHDAATRWEMVFHVHSLGEVMMFYGNTNPYPLVSGWLFVFFGSCSIPRSQMGFIGKNLPRFKMVTMKYDDTCKAGSSQQLSASSENMWHPRVL